MRGKITKWLQFRFTLKNRRSGSRRAPLLLPPPPPRQPSTPCFRRLTLRPGLRTGRCSWSPWPGRPGTGTPQQCRAELASSKEACHVAPLWSDQQGELQPGPWRRWGRRRRGWRRRRWAAAAAAGWWLCGRHGSLWRSCWSSGGRSRRSTGRHRRRDARRLLWWAVDRWRCRAERC